jgi:predicted nucleic acid-binding protein
VAIDAVPEPKTATATAIELQYVMESEWERSRLAAAHREIAAFGIELVPLTTAELDAAAEMRAEYEALNVFDGIHLGMASVLDEPIVSTDTLFPDIEDIEHVDPRTLS